MATRCSDGRRVAVCLCLFLVLGGRSCYAGTGSIAREGVPVWVGKEVIAKLKKGQTVAVTAEREGWLGISFETDKGKRSGWVKKIDVILEPAASKPPETVTITREGAPVWIGNRVIGKLKKGQVVPVTERKGEWLAVTIETESGRKRGWVRSVDAGGRPGTPTTEGREPAMDGQLSPRKLKALKAATVFVEVWAPGGRTYGSGFLVERTRSSGHVVTGAQTLDLGEQPIRNVSVTFDSGEKGQRTLKATVLADDPDRCLAVLKVEGDNLPAPMPLSRIAVLKETLPVYIFGFPFGKAMATARSKPTITVGRGSVSSIRRGDFGDVSIVQIDGDINPGHAGGPIVDSRGELVGVAIARLLGTQISAAVHPSMATEMWPCNVGEPSFKELTKQKNSVKLGVNARLVEITAKVKSVSLALVPRDQLRSMPKRDGDAEWPAVSPDRAVHSLAIRDAGARGEVVLSSDGRDEREYVWQMVFVRDDGSTHYTRPGSLTVDFAEQKKDDGDDWIPAQKGAEPPVAAVKPDDTRPAAGRPRPGTTDGKPVAAKIKPVVVGTVLAGPYRVEGGATVVPLRGIDGDRILPCMQWSEGGKYVYLLGSRGVLRKLSVPQLKEERRVNLGQPCQWMARSKAGLAVALMAEKGMWIVDEDTLEVKNQFEVRHVESVACSPGSAVGYLAVHSSYHLKIMDLETGKVHETIDGPQVQQEWHKRYGRRARPGLSSPGQFSHPIVTPDGKYLFCISRGGVQRFRIKGRDLKYETSGWGISGGRIACSADSKRIAQLSTISFKVKKPPKDHAIKGAKDGTGAYIYSVGDQMKPLVRMRVPKDWGRPTLAYDTAMSRVYVGRAHDREIKILSFDREGRPEQTTRISHRGHQLHQLLVHPSGGRMLVLAKALYWVSLPEAPEPEGTLDGVPVAGVLEGTRVPSIEPGGTGKALRGATQTVGGIKFTAISLTSRLLVPNHQWSSDGKSVFVLERAGLLRKLSVPDFTEERQLAITGGGAWLDRSKEGLLVSVTDPNELWIVDERDLKPTKCIPLDEPSSEAARYYSPVDGFRVVSSPRLTQAFTWLSSTVGWVLKVIDLPAGRTISHVLLARVAEDHEKSVKKHKSARRLDDIGTAAVTPDGQYLICVNRGGGLQRFRVERSGLVYEEAGPPLRAAHGLSFSADSQYVSDSPRHLYSVRDFSEPAYVLQHGQLPGAAGIDATAKKVYALGRLGREHLFRVLSYDGKLEMDVPMTLECDAHQFLVHPDGKKLILHGLKGLWWVEVP